MNVVKGILLYGHIQWYMYQCGTVYRGTCTFFYKFTSTTRTLYCTCTRVLNYKFYKRTVSEQNCDLHEAVDIKAPQSPFVPYRPLPSLDVHPGSHSHTPVVLSHVPWLLHSTSSVVPGCEVTNVNPAPVPVKEPAAIARLGTFPCSVLKVTLIAK